MTGCWWWRRLGFPLACLQIVAGPLRDSQGMVDRFTDCRNRSDAELGPRLGIPLPAPQVVAASPCSIPSSCKAVFLNCGGGNCWFLSYRLKHNTPSIVLPFINGFVVQIHRISKDFCFAFVRTFGKIVYGGDKTVVNPKFHAACFCHD